MSWHSAQTAFAAALRDPELAVPDVVATHRDLPAEKRFNIYRNNSIVSLKEAIANTYPVVRELVGDEFFSAMAGLYVSDHLPGSPVLIEYGGGFADFIAAFEPAQAMPFLADVARLEWAWNTAYHAADCGTIDASALQQVEVEQLQDIRLRLHPSVQIVQSHWPAVSIWSAHQLDEESARRKALADIDVSGECGLIVRPQFDVSVHRVVPDVARLLTALGDGAALGEAFEALEETSVEQCGGLLSYVFSIGAVASIITS